MQKPQNVEWITGRSTLFFMPMFNRCNIENDMDHLPSLIISTQTTSIQPADHATIPIDDIYIYANCSMLQLALGSFLSRAFRLLEMLKMKHILFL